MPQPFDIFAITQQVRGGSHLTRAQARDVFNEIMSGQVAEEPLADFLQALAAKGETVEEITGGR